MELASSEQTEAKKNVKEWTTNDVIEWMEKELKLNQYSPSFLENEIDGDELVNLTAEILSKDLGVSKYIFYDILGLNHWFSTCFASFLHLTKCQNVSTQRYNQSIYIYITAENLMERNLYCFFTNSEICLVSDRYFKLGGIFPWLIIPV